MISALLRLSLIRPCYPTFCAACFLLRMARGPQPATAERVLKSGRWALLSRGWGNMRDIRGDLRSVCLLSRRNRRRRPDFDNAVEQLKQKLRATSRRLAWPCSRTVQKLLADTFRSDSTQGVASQALTESVGFRLAPELRLLQTHGAGVNAQAGAGWSIPGPESEWNCRSSIRMARCRCRTCSTTGGRANGPSHPAEQTEVKEAGLAVDGVACPLISNALVVPGAPISAAAPYSARTRRRVFISKSPRAQLLIRLKITG
jgi:hypothetical protein